MEERFSLVSKVPETALKKIEAGRLKNKTDINPQWKISAITEVYGLCGEGWKEEILDIKEYTSQDGELMIFMKVSFQYKTKEGTWSEPVYGFGGDYIIKKERDGLRTNDEAFKMVETDALGNALKKVGVANDIYRGFWDGSKYSRSEESAIVKKEEPKPAVMRKDGKTYVMGRNGYVELTTLPLNALNSIMNNPAFKECHQEVFELMSKMQNC